LNSGVLLTSQYSNALEQPPATTCTGSYQRVTSKSTVVQTLTQSAPLPTDTKFTVVLIVPKGTLQSKGYTTRDVKTFNVCLGKNWLASLPVTAAWKAKNLGTGNPITNSIGINGVYWGWVLDCSVLGNQGVPGNPCVSLKTKDSTVLGPALGL